MLLNQINPIPQELDVLVLIFQSHKDVFSGGFPMVIQGPT